MSKRALLFAIALLLLPGIGSRAQAQEPDVETSPFFVNPLFPVSAVPSVVRTGEFFTVTYRIEFLTRTDDGREIVPLLDQTFKTPDGGYITLGSFKLVGYTVKKYDPVGSHERWDVTLKLYIVNAKKSGDASDTKRGKQVEYEIPEISFAWAMKPIGEELDLAKQRQNAMRSPAVPVVYASSIPTNAKYLRPYENASFKSHLTAARAIEYGGYGLIAALLLMSVLLFVVPILRDHRRYALAVGDFDEGNKKEGHADLRLPERQRARRGALRIFVELQGALRQPMTREAALKMQHIFRETLRGLLASEAGLTLAHTDDEIRDRIEERCRGTKDGDLIIALARILTGCRNADIEGRLNPVLDGLVGTAVIELREIRNRRTFMGRIRKMFAGVRRGYDWLRSRFQ